MSDAGTGQVPGLSPYQRGVRDGANEMKERCAQVARSTITGNNSYKDARSEEIAALIDALKDGP
jgi:hypothetical protein